MPGREEGHTLTLRARETHAPTDMKYWTLKRGLQLKEVERVGTIDPIVLGMAGSMDSL